MQITPTTTTAINANTHSCLSICSMNRMASRKNRCICALRIFGSIPGPQWLLNSSSRIGGGGGPRIPLRSTSRHRIGIHLADCKPIPYNYLSKTHTSRTREQPDYPPRGHKAANEKVTRNCERLGEGQTGLPTQQDSVSPPVSSGPHPRSPATTPHPSSEPQSPRLLPPSKVMNQKAVVSLNLAQRGSDGHHLQPVELQPGDIGPPPADDGLQDVVGEARVSAHLHHRQQRARARPEEIDGLIIQ